MLNDLLPCPVVRRMCGLSRDAPDRLYGPPDDLTGLIRFPAATIPDQPAAERVTEAEVLTVLSHQPLRIAEVRQGEAGLVMVEGLGSIVAIPSHVTGCGPEVPAMVEVGVGSKLGVVLSRLQAGAGGEYVQEVSALEVRCG